LHEGLYVCPTPAGAYYCVASPDGNPSRRLLQSLIAADRTPLLSLETLRGWVDTDSDEEGLELLYQLQSLGWLEGHERQLSASPDTLESFLPKLLPRFSGGGKVLLADDQGLYLASVGFTHETAIELSAASADLASLYQRHQGLLNRNMNLETSAWALVDAAGNSRVGFWPMYIGAHRFVLVISGVPRLNHAGLTELIWVLSKRYADSPVQEEVALVDSSP